MEMKEQGRLKRTPRFPVWATIWKVVPVISASDPEVLRNSVGYQVEGGRMELISSCCYESMVTFLGPDGGLFPKAGLGHSRKGERKPPEVGFGSTQWEASEFRTWAGIFQWWWTEKLMLNAYIKKKREREASGSLARCELGAIVGCLHPGWSRRYLHRGCDRRWSSWRSCGNWAPMGGTLSQP